MCKYACLVIMSLFHRRRSQSNDETPHIGIHTIRRIVSMTITCDPKRESLIISYRCTQKPLFAIKTPEKKAAKTTASMKNSISVCLNLNTDERLCDLRDNWIDCLIKISLFFAVLARKKWTHHLNNGLNWWYSIFHLAQCKHNSKSQLKTHRTSGWMEIQR